MARGHGEQVFGDMVTTSTGREEVAPVVHRFPRRRGATREESGGAARGEDGDEHRRIGALAAIANAKAGAALEAELGRELAAEHPRASPLRLARHRDSETR